MKKFLFISGLALMAIGCTNNTESKKDDSMVMASSSEKIDYAYLPREHQPDNWDRGDQKNVALVLNSLKAWADGNIAESVKNFADTVVVQWDGFDGKVSKDTLLQWFRHDYTVQIKMDDYETVTSKDKKDNWVSLWYTEIHTDKSGKVDSVFNMDDLKIDNGKIVLLDQKTRRFPKPKP
jgi:malate synthase